jgi:hypothetical protein
MGTPAETLLEPSPRVWQGQRGVEGN